MSLDQQPASVQEGRQCVFLSEMNKLDSIKSSLK